MLVIPLVLAFNGPASAIDKNELDLHACNGVTGIARKVMVHRQLGEDMLNFLADEMKSLDDYARNKGIAPEKVRPFKDVTRALVQRALKVPVEVERESKLAAVKRFADAVAAECLSEPDR